MLGIGLLTLLAAVYAAGQWRLSRRGRHAAGIRAAWFWGGWLALFAALASPLDRLADASFAAHMIQHELMMIVAAPLLVAARPLGTLLWGLPAAFARLAKQRALRSGLAALSAPLAAWCLHTLILWGWHVPGAFEKALAHDGVHWFQHVTFFAAAVVFWWSVLYGSRTVERRGFALLSLLTTIVHTTVLGVLLTFSPRPWYASYIEAVHPWGLSPLEDQQLGGLIMWVPGGIVFLVAGLVVTARWLHESGGGEPTSPPR